MRYLVISGGTLVGLIALVWAYVILAPMAFMESGYAAWAAKSTLLDACQLGDIVFFGDSRAEAGVIPAMLPVPSTNVALPAATAIETEIAVRRALACPTAPKQAVLALIPDHFGAVDPFYWLLSLRYGFVTPGEAGRLQDLAERLDDRRTFALNTPDGLHGRVRDWLYGLRFPSVSFSNLVQGRVFGRLATNRAHYATVLGDRGWAAYNGDNGGLGPAFFEPTAVQTTQYDTAIRQLQARGVQVSLLVMPFSRSHPPSDAVRTAYLHYLTGVTQRFPGVRLIDDGVPIWPDRLFTDKAHLRPEGARAFTERLATCVVDGVIKAGCDLTWRDAEAAR